MLKVFLIVSYKCSPMLLRATTLLTIAALLTCAAWGLDWLLDIEELRVPDGIAIISILGVLGIQVVGALVLKNYVAVVRTLREHGIIQEGPMAADEIRNELTDPAHLRRPH